MNMREELLLRGKERLRLGSVVEWDKFPGVTAVIGAIGDECALVVAEEGGTAVMDGDVPLDALALDLTSKTSRMHAAEWLAENIDATSTDVGGRTRDRMQMSGIQEIPLRSCGVLWSPDGLGPAWMLSTWNSNYTWWFAAERCLACTTVVPALAALDMDDPRLLPDGSRWVDAMALKLVCEHVAKEMKS